MVTEIAFTEEKHSLQVLRFFLVILILIMEVFVLYHVSTVAIVWNKVMAQIVPCMLLISSSAVALGAMACELNAKRSVINSVFTIFWSVYLTLKIQAALQDIASITPTYAIVHTAVTSLLGGMSVYKYTYRGEKADKLYNAQFFTFVLKRIIPTYVGSLVFAIVLLYCIFLRLSVS